jgi:hypothetical protein
MEVVHLAGSISIRNSGDSEIGTQHLCALVLGQWEDLISRGHGCDVAAQIVHQIARYGQYGEIPILSATGLNRHGRWNA